jgi:3'-phosphoadenosine 5'-phosphosulfate sulfotransferase (PAPS reductase)/FAD synthetase
VLGISGGRDSAALAVFMRQHYPDLDVEYFFTDTGKELPEVYEFLVRLEGFLGKPILRLNPDRDFDFWLAQYRNFLPSPQTRWCTRQLKIRPFEAWLRPELEAGVRITSYVAIRADEPYREGYASNKANLDIRLPFREHSIDLAGVKELLTASGVGLPAYYRWRSRSGCTFCFFQQKIEWVRLKEEHPEAFEEAKRYEKVAREHASPFTWSAGESLEELEQPTRVAEIRVRHEERLARLRAAYRPHPLEMGDHNAALEDPEPEGKGCLVCHK